MSHGKFKKTAILTAPKPSAISSWKNARKSIGIPSGFFGGLFLFILACDGVQDPASTIDSNAEDELSSDDTSVESDGSKDGGVDSDDGACGLGEVDAGGPCGLDEFACVESGVCLPSDWRCDGMFNCRDGSDEAACPCDEDEFACVDTGTCIYNDWLCDGMNDCADGSDESECLDAVCPDDDFKCEENGVCIPADWVCDAMADCVDGSDEADCLSTICGEDELKCVSDGACIPIGWQCDAYEDCLDGSDETDCFDLSCDNDEIRCEAGGGCIPLGWLCDNEEDCPDGADEMGCDDLVCEAEQFSCSRVNSCIPVEWRCDGMDDCGDNSDEEGCEEILCGQAEYQCTDAGNCISQAQRCDGVDDCADGNDETDCSASKLKTSPYVIGTDNRTKVKDTTKWPYSAIVKIYTYWTESLNAEQISFECTGALITEDTVLTAAHCLYDSIEYGSGYAYSIRVTPGSYLDSKGKEVAPFGNIYGKKIFVPRKYRSNEYDKAGRIPFDYGVIKLKTKVSKAKTLRFGVIPSPLGQKALMRAYQKDVSSGGVMTESSDKVRSVSQDNETFNHYVDCESKASGAAITGSGDFINVVYGLHSSSMISLSTGGKYNAGVLINDDVFDDITSWSE